MPVELSMNTIKRIYVDQHVIRKNIKNPLGSLLPPCTVQNRGKSVKGFSVKIQGPSEVIYRPDKPLGCGARLWVETRSAVDVDGLIIE